MADKIVSWGGYESKGTSGMSVTGSLELTGTALSTSVFNIRSSTNPTPKFDIRESSGGYLISAISGRDVVFHGTGAGNYSVGFTTANYDGTTLPAYQYRFFADVVANSNFRLLNSSSQTIQQWQSNQNSSIGTTSNSARLHIQGAGTTSSTTSLLVQNSSAQRALQVFDDRTTYITGASGTSLSITAAIESNSSVIKFNNDGLIGGYGGGYTFTNGFNGSYGSSVSMRIYSNKVGIGNVSEPTMQNNQMNLYVDNTQTGGRNKAIKLNVNFPNITTEFNGINLDTIENGTGGAFVGSQYNPLTTGYDSDLSVFCTSGGPNSYTEVARFIGKFNSFYVGTNKTLAVASAKLQVESTTQGFLPPRMTTAEKAAIASPAAGLMVYDTSLNQMSYYNGSTWVNF